MGLGKFEKAIIYKLHEWGIFFVCLTWQTVIVVRPTQA